MEVIKEIKEEPGLSEPSLPEVVTTRVKIPETDSTPSLETMMDLWQKQQGYIDHLESKVKRNGKKCTVDSCSKLEYVQSHNTHGVISVTAA